jgi:hypothetical protein
MRTPPDPPGHRADAPSQKAPNARIAAFRVSMSVMGSHVRCGHRAGQSGGRLGTGRLQDRAHYLAERHRGVDLAVCDCPQQRCRRFESCSGRSSILYFRHYVHLAEVGREPIVRRKPHEQGGRLKRNLICAVLSRAPEPEPGLATVASGSRRLIPVRPAAHSLGSLRFSNSPSRRWSSRRGQAAVSSQPC